MPAKADITAIYLNKKAPTSAGVIENEIGGADAQLVQSNSAKTNGIVYAKGGRDAVHNGTQLLMEYLFKYTGLGALGSKRDNISVTEMEFYVRVVATTIIRVGISSDGLTFTDTDFTVPNLDTGLWNNLTINYNAGNIDINLNGTSQSGTNVSTSIHQGTGELHLFSIGPFVPFIGGLSRIKIGPAEFHIAEGAGAVLFNTGTGEDAQLIGYTLLDFWSETQDIHHYNFLYGFDLWEHATLAKMRVPVGATVTESGYTFTDTYPAGKWHNNAETLIDLPDALKTVIDLNIDDPLAYVNFQNRYGLSGFSNTEIKQHKYLVFYNRDLTIPEILKIEKCLRHYYGENTMFDVDGIILRDLDGLIMESLGE